MLSLVRYVICAYFAPDCGLWFSCAVLGNARVVNFDEVQHIFLFVACAFSASKILSPNPRPQRFIPVLRGYGLSSYTEL